MTAHAAFGATLKQWRRRRRMSQLDLGLTAEISARHISFLETGRSKPSRDMVLRLAEVLHVPPAGTNQMLHSAGFAPLYGRAPAGAEELRPVRAAMDMLLARHTPYPGLVVDRHWNLVEANPAAATMLGAAGLSGTVNLMRGFIDSGPLRNMVENWSEVAAMTLSRLRMEIAHLGGDETLEGFARELAADPQIAAWRPPSEAPVAALIPVRYRLGDQRMSLFSTVAQFGTVQDLAFADLRIELMFPADEATAALFAAMEETSAGKAAEPTDR